MTKEQTSNLFGLYVISVFMREHVYQRIDWTVEVFREQHPDTPVIDCQNALFKFIREEQ